MGMRGQEGALLLFWSENHRITEWLGFEGTWKGDHPRQDQLEQVTQEHIQVRFGMSPERDIAGSELCHTQRKEIPSHVEVKLAVF